jgi:hypothetical protein
VLAISVILLSSLFNDAFAESREFAPVLATGTALSEFAINPHPWLGMEANSEQRQPVYIGISPREISLGLPGAGVLELPPELRALGARHFARVRAALVKSRTIGPSAAIEFEVWPAREDEGRLTWTIARWRTRGRNESDRRPWFWIKSAELGEIAQGDEPAPFLPLTLRPWKSRERATIFEDFLLSNNLYAKPAFGDCVWTSENGLLLSGAWIPTSRASVVERDVMRETTPGARRVCRVIPQPARFNGKPVSFSIRVDASGKSRWPSGISWKPRPGLSDVTPRVTEKPVVSAWPASFEAEYLSDILVLDGEAEATFPISKRTARFTRKNSADSGHQLEALVDYLDERYQVLKISTQRQRFTWRGIKQSNLIAIIPGRAPRALNRPVLMADHIDTAFSEDEFARSGHRVAAPGADDNISAVAALLRAAELTRDISPWHDIWLVHLTGEEFPADDLGARALVGELLAAGRDISGLVLLDMIGVNSGGTGLFQISAGDSRASLEIARTAADAARGLVAPGMRAVIRTRFDRRSYLYNTDGLIFSDVGFPVILFNEHLNALENIDRTGYHHSSDVAAMLDIKYAASIAKTAIETVARLAMRRE